MSYVSRISRKIGDKTNRVSNRNDELIRKPSSKMYLVAFALYLAAYNLNFTTFRDLSYLHIDAFYLGVRIFCAVTLFAQIVRMGFTRWQIALYCVCACVIVISTAISGNWNILLLFLFVVAGKGIGAKQLARVSLLCSICIVIVTVAAASAGIISSVSLYSLNNTLRQAPGFTHPNSLGVLLLSISCAFSILRYREFSLIDIVFYAFMYYLCNVVVFSRTSAHCILVIAILSFSITVLKSRGIDRMLIAIGIVLFFFLDLLTVFCMVFYDPSINWMHGLNSLLSGRLDLMHYFCVYYPPSPFGFNFDSISVNYGSFNTFLVDNAYAHIILESGILVALLLSVAWLLTMLQALRAGDLRPSIFGLIVFSLVAFSETAAFFICINFCLIGISEALYSPKRSVHYVKSS